MRHFIDRLKSFLAQEFLGWALAMDMRGVMETVAEGIIGVIIDGILKYRLPHRAR